MGVGVARLRSIRWKSAGFVRVLAAPWLAALALGAIAPAAGAQAPPSPAGAGDAHAESVRALERKLEAAERYMQTLRSELDALKSGTVPPAPGAQPAGPPAEPPSAARPQPGPEVARAPTAPPGAEPEAPGDGEEPVPEEERPVFTPAFLREAQAVLIPRNRLELTPSLQWTYDDSAILAVAGLDIIESIFIGTIRVEKQRRHGLTAQLDGRYGITDRLQASLTVPYRYIYSQVFSPPQVQRFPDSISDDITHTNHLGDIEFGFSYHTLREDGWIPDLILGVTTKTTTGEGPFETGANDLGTGSGFWGLRGQATIVKVTDPGILFGSASYMWHIEDEISGLTVDPGDIFQLTGGFAYALNPYLSLTTRIEANYVEGLQLEDNWIDGTEQWLSTLSFGVTYGLNRRAALDFGLEIGLTDDTPDLRFTVGAPLQFVLPPWDRLFRRGKAKM